MAAARARSAVDWRRDHPPDRDVGRRPAGAIQAEGQRHAGGGRLVGAHGPGQRVPADPGDEVRPPDDESGLRPADQLVAAEQDEVRARGQPLGRQGLVRQAVGGRVEQRARSEVVDDDRPVAMGELGERRPGRAPR